MALKKVKGNLERMFDKNLTDLVRGIRNNKDNESKYIVQCVEEIKQELRQDNIAVKANAVAKLTYLQMLGYDISWAAFNIIEVMSSAKFTYKRIGYLAASQCFHEGTEVLMLTTNMVRKDLNSQNQYDAGTALTGLACFITSDLARDLANDIMMLLTSTKPYLRKKAVLILYKVFLKFPEALRPAFSRLKEKLEDPDPGVQSAAVNVVCELARKNPKNYLSLAPVFFKLMTSSTNNWMLIKIIKLFGALTPLEPRLGKKLIEPLTNLIHSTSAMSLLYECINTVIAVLISISSGMPNHNASIQLCVQKLRILIEDSDQNLKYLGLLAMSKILKTHPKSVQAHKDLVLGCLDDKDESIRLRALDLLYGMVSKKNLMEIVKKLMIHMDKAEGTTYRDELLSKIIEICSQNNYQYITNFEWYVSILVELTQIEGTKHGKLIASQMLDVAIRVQAIRPFAVAQMALLLDSIQLLAGSPQRNSICEVLYAAAWICGEFAESVPNPRATLEAMLRGKVTSLPGHIQSVYVQNVMKLYARILACRDSEEEESEMTNGIEVNEDVHEVGQLLVDKLPMFVQSADLEVQERACCMLQMVKYVLKLQAKGELVADEVAALFIGELNPVAPKAQRKVPLLDGLDLDSWINDPPSESSDEEEEPVTNFLQSSEHVSYHRESTQKTYEPSEEELEKRREARKLEQASNPHYLKSYPARSRGDLDRIEDIPVTQIDLNVPLHIPDKYLIKNNQLLSKKKKKKKHRRGRVDSVPSEVDERDLTPVVVNTNAGEMPEGAKSTDEEEENVDDPHRALDIDLDDASYVPTHIPTGNVDDRLPKGKPSDDAENEASERHRKERRHRKDKEKHSRSKKKHHDSKERKHKKKKKKRKEGEGDEEEPSLMMNDDVGNNGTTSPVDVGPTEENHISEGDVANTTGKMAEHDLDFWLSNPESAPAENKETIAENKDLRVKHSGEGDGPRIVEKTKSKKEKKTKREEKKKKTKQKPKDKSEYEEALGISTPSKEQINAVATPMTPSFPPMSSYKLLAEDKSIKMTHEPRVMPNETGQIVLSIIFANVSGSQVKELEWNVLDTSTTKLMRGSTADHVGMKVPFQLPPGATNEGQFAFAVDCVTAPQKLRGTLTYMVVMEDGLTHEKLDFTLTLPCSSFLIGSLYKRDTFAELLGSGDLTHKSSLVVPDATLDFSHALARTCFHAHFCVVEQVELTASLYSRSIQDHHLCLLIKALPNNRLSVDGKATNAQLLENIMEEIGGLLSRAASSVVAP